MATNPLHLSSLRAVRTASAHFFKPFRMNCFLPCAEAALDTILPVLFFISLSLVRPDCVFVLFPLNTDTLERLPLAITLTRFFFLIARMAFIARIAFIAPMALRIPFIAMLGSRGVTDQDL